MRIVFVGAGEVSVKTARALIKNHHEVIMIESDKSKIDLVSRDLDCSFLLGDGSHPNILREINPKHTDILLCLTKLDQVNILASLVAQSLGFKRIVTSIVDGKFESICRELNLKNVIVPVQLISRYLQDFIDGNGDLEITTALKYEARLFSFIYMATKPTVVNELELPTDAKVICYYRNDKFYHAYENTKLMQDDEIVILTHSKHLPQLRNNLQLKPGARGLKS